MKLSPASRLLALSVLGLACDGREELTVALEITRAACQAPDCCETTYLDAVHSVRLLGGHLTAACASLPALGAVAPIDRPGYLERAVAGSVYPDLDEGTSTFWVLGYDDGACSAGHEVLCGQGTLVLPPRWNKISVPVSCVSEGSTGGSRSLTACVAASHP